MGFLYPTQIIYWDTKHPGRRDQAYYDEYLLNTNRMVELVEDGDDVKFRFNNDPEDRRDCPDNIKIADTTVDAIAFWHDLGHPSKFITLPLFPGTDLTATTVNTTLEYDDIAYVWSTARDHGDGVCRMVYYPKAWERREVVVDHSYLAMWVYDWLGIWID